MTAVNYRFSSVGCRILRAMAYDTELADLVRELVAPERGVEEPRMFGGLAFAKGGR